MALRIHHTPYVLPLISTWPGVRDRQLTQRGGWLVSMDDGYCQGYGDCAPFPQAGTESHSQAQRFLENMASRGWTDGNALLSELERKGADSPAASHALETAALDLQSRKPGIPPAQTAE